MTERRVWRMVGTRLLWANPMLWYANIIQGWWLLGIVQSPDGLGCVGLAGLLKAFHSLTAVAVVLAVGLAGSLWVAANPPQGRLARIAMLMPQQVALTISATSAWQAMAVQAYADGIARPFWFISSDQIHYVAAAGLHALAVIQEGARREL